VVTDLKQMTVAELLKLHAMIGDELRSREIVRSSNNPTGDYAEYLFCRAFGWEQAGNSEKGFDAVSSDGKTRYQIKGRRVHDLNKSRQLSAIRDLEAGPFDMLAGVIFDADFQVSRAALIPCSVILARSTFIERTNSYRFLLRDDIWQEPGVQDVTAELVAATP
jgi:hypothetical protein